MRHTICCALFLLALVPGAARADNGSAAGTYLVYLSLDGAQTTGGGTSQVPYHPTVTYQKQQSYAVVRQISSTLDEVTVYINLVWTRIVTPGRFNILVSGMPPMVVPVLPQSLPAGFAGFTGDYDGFEFPPGDQLSMDTNSLYGPIGEFFVVDSGPAAVAQNLQWSHNIDITAGGRLRGTISYISQDGALDAFFNPAVPTPLIQKVP
ncbi:MAG TPA: hypothetical protein VMH86_15475 [Rhizomicrobium sp.]|nr:hypothetical protein [Rhizomicrobium sp.]